MQALTIFDTVLGMANDWFQARRARAQARLEADIQIERRRVDADIDWDRIQAQNSGNSWKDEWWTIVLSIPAILAFIPASQPFVMSGFESLVEMPIWYQAMLATAVAAAFGRQQLINFMTGTRNSQTSQSSADT